MKKAPSLAKGIGTFSFWGGFEAETYISFSVYRQPSRSPPAFSHWGARVKRNKPKELLDLQEFRSQCQKFRFTRMFRVERDARQVMPNAQDIQAFARKLRRCLTPRTILLPNFVGKARQLLWSSFDAHFHPTGAAPLSPPVSPVPAWVPNPAYFVFNKFKAFLLVSVLRRLLLFRPRCFDTNPAAPSFQCRFNNRFVWRVLKSRMRLPLSGSCATQTLFCITSNRLISLLLICTNVSIFPVLRRGHFNFGMKGHFYFGLTQAESGLDIF
jgi:hypothetical protein